MSRVKSGKSCSGSVLSKSGSEQSGTSGASYRTLVKWLTGKYAGTFTHDVDPSWVVDFNPNSEYRTESHLIEWRVPPLPRTGQWPVYDGQVLEYSDGLEFLKRRMTEEKRKQRCEDDSVLKDNTNNITPSNRTCLPKNLSDEDFQKLLSTFLARAVNSPSSASLPNSQADENQMKVGEVLYLSKTAYTEATLARTPTSMTMDLVRAAFSANRLRKSTYAGQKRLQNGNFSQKPSLKKYRKMRDIQNFVNQRFKHFSLSSFGHAVNACVGKNVDKRPPKQLVDESEESGSASEGDQE